MAALNPAEVEDAARRLIGFRRSEAERLERIYLYCSDTRTVDSHPKGSTLGPFAWLPAGATQDVKNLARIARVNMLRFVVNAVVQSLYVDGFRAPKVADEDPAWEVWQLNRMDARQIGVHRAAGKYGASYAVVLPGDPVPAIRGVSPRNMTAVYTTDDEDWPDLALEKRRGKGLYALYDADKRWWVRASDEDGTGRITVEGSEVHGVGRVPVVRFRATIDDDDDASIEGDVEPYLALQDQINVTTFGLLVAQQFGAFRQRYIMGWVAETEQAAMTASARKLWTFEDPDIKVGEFGQTDLSGYIDSREASLRHLATVSQTPAHELLGQLVNLSAEALAAAEASARRKITERQVSFGESWEQVLELAGDIETIPTDPMASVRWRDTEARSLTMAADALTKLVTLGVPAQELWEKIPGVTQQEIDRWKATAGELAEGDPMRALAQQLADAETGGA